MATKQSKVTVPMRPLTKGILNNLPPSGIPMGGLAKTEGAIMSEAGVGRRLAFNELITLPSISYFRFLGNYRNDEGNYDILFIDDSGNFGSIDIVEGTTTYIEAEYDNTVNLWSASEVIGTKTLEMLSAGVTWYDTGVRVGDEIDLSYTTPAGPWTVVSFISDTVIEVDVASNFTSGSSGTPLWSITYKNFASAEGEEIDWVQYLNYFIFTDNKRQPFYYDGSILQPVVTEADYRCKTVAIAWDRLYYGNITYEDNDVAPSNLTNPVMVAWAETTGDISSIDPSIHYTHLPYCRGEINKLALVGNLMLACYTNGVMIGSRTTIAGSTLPIAFEKFETEERGIYSNQGIAYALDGAYFASKNNIFSLSNALQLDRIGDPIAADYLAGDRTLRKTQILNAPRRGQLFLFLSLDSGVNLFDHCLAYNTTTKAWSHFSVDYRNFSILDAASGETYADAPVTLTYGDIDPSLTYAAFSITKNVGYLAATKDNTIYVTNVEAISDSGSPIYFYIETGDLDLGKPDLQKTYSRLGVKIYKSVPSDITFLVEASNDQGSNWYTLGNITILTGDVEAYTNFIFTGPATRFRISSSSEVYEYVITELTLDVKVKGLQYDNM